MNATCFKQPGLTTVRVQGRAACLNCVPSKLLEARVGKRRSSLPCIVTPEPTPLAVWVLARPSSQPTLSTASMSKVFARSPTRRFPADCGRKPTVALSASPKFPASSD